MGYARLRIGNVRQFMNKWNNVHRGFDSSEVSFNSLIPMAMGKRSNFYIPIRIR